MKKELWQRRVVRCSRIFCWYHPPVALWAVCIHFETPWFDGKIERSRRCMSRTGEESSLCASSSRKSPRMTAEIETETQRSTPSAQQPEQARKPFQVEQSTRGHVSPRARSTYLYAHSYVGVSHPVTHHAREVVLVAAERFWGQQEKQDDNLRLYPTERWRATARAPGSVAGHLTHTGASSSQQQLFDTAVNALVAQFWLKICRPV